MKKQKGITLIILVITIVVIVILGGSSIYLIIGQQGTVNKVSEGKNKYSESEIKEKIEMAIMDIQMQESKKENELTKKAIIDNIEEKIDGLIINDVELMELYYENYLIEIDDEFKVKVTKTNGIIPIIKYTLSTKEKNVNSVDVTINARINDSKGINKIILPDNTQVEADIANYTIDVNGKYEFRVIANNGNEKKCIINITNIIPKIVGESISDILEKDIPDGNNIFLIKGSTDKITKETKEYNVEIINYNEDVQYSLEEGQTTRTIKLGDETSEKKMLIVKYNKNLTIDKGVTLTANTTTDTINNTKGLCCKKGMYIYVNQTLTNNGLITMTARGTVNEAGENVYLWKNTDNSYEYIPAVGGAGAGRVKRNTDGLTGGATGGTGTNRRTGGGGSGAASRWATATSYSGAGAAGTSYSGGTGGGGCSARLGGTFYGGNGAANGGAGGAALTKKENSRPCQD